MIPNIIFYSFRGLFVCLDIMEIIITLIAVTYSWNYGHLFFGKIKKELVTTNYVRDNWSSLLHQDFQPLLQTMTATVLSCGRLIIDGFVFVSCLIVFYFAILGFIEALNRLVSFLGTEIFNRKLTASNGKTQ